MNCIKIGLPGKSILGDYFQENMSSRRPLLLLRISFPGRPILYNCLQVSGLLPMRRHAPEARERHPVQRDPLRGPPRREPAGPPQPAPPHRPVLLADGGRVARLALSARLGAVALPHRRAGEWRENSNVAAAAAVVVLDDVLEGPRRMRVPHVVRLALLGHVQDGL